MEVINMFKGLDQLKLIKGVEKDLRKRQYTSKLGLGIGVLAAVFQFLLAFVAVFSKDEKVSDWIVAYITSWPENFLAPQYWGLYLLTAALCIYLLLSHTRFLLKEAREPFHFTFWITPFNYIENQDGKSFVSESHNQLKNEMHHDLMTKLADRIRRLSLLNLDAVSEKENFSAPGSHIQISGNFYFRNENGTHTVHVLPKVRIGDALQSETMTYPVNYELTEIDPFKVGISHSDYTKILERVYSRVATEIYSQIQKDLDNKMKLQPTRYTRAIAYYNEAKDFARSNTIDAYDIAIELYQKSLDYLDPYYHHFISKMPFPFPITQWGVRIIHTWAKTKIEHAKCLIYRRQISALSGRFKNPLFEIPENLKTVIDKLAMIDRTADAGDWKTTRQKQPVKPGYSEYAHFSMRDFRDIDGLIARLQAACRAENQAAGESTDQAYFTEIDKIVTGYFSTQEKNAFLKGETPEYLHQTCLDTLNRLLGMNTFELKTGKLNLESFDHNQILAEKLTSIQQPQIRTNRPLRRLLRTGGTSSKAITRLSNRAKFEYCYPGLIISLEEQRVHDQRQQSTMHYLTFSSSSHSGILGRDKEMADKHRAIIFDAHVVLALAYNYLDVTRFAQKYLADAKAIAPNLSEKNALYLVAAGETEPELEKKIPYLVRATELAPAFEIAHYLLATCHEMIFRNNDELTEERARHVIQRYDRVLELNPGNIASLVSQGNLLWLVRNYDEARKKFFEGIDMKAIVQQTFIGELLYGLARVMAETGHFNRCFDYYTKAISADPGVATYSTILSSRKITMPYYDYIGRNMLKRYEAYWNAVQEKLEEEACLAENDIADADLLIIKLRDYKNTSANLIYRDLGPDLQQFIEQYPRLKFIKEQIIKKLIRRLNGLIADPGHDILFQELSALLPQPHADSEVQNRLRKRKILEQVFNNCFNTKAIAAPQLTELPRSVSRTVRAMALNEYANACLNYYLRFGYAATRTLETAVECYEKASRLVDDKNKVILYNLLNAYNFNRRNTNYEEQAHLLNKTLNASSTWHTGSMSLVQLGIQLFKNREEELFVDISRERENLEKTVQELNVLSSALTGKGNLLEGHSEGFRDSESRRERDQATSKQSFRTEGEWKGGSDFSQRFRAESGRGTEIEKKIQEIKNNIKEMENELQQIPAAKEDFINQQVVEFISKSKLFSLYEGLQTDESGEKIVDLVKNIEKNRLDDTDLEAISLWAEALANRELSPKARENAEWLSMWLRREYCMGTFSLLQILKSLHLQKLAFLMKTKHRNNRGAGNGIERAIGFNAEFQMHLLNIDYLNRELNEHIGVYLLKYPKYFSYEKLFLFNTECDIADILCDPKHAIQLYETAVRFYRKGLKNLKHHQAHLFSILQAAAAEALYKNKNYSNAIPAFEEALTFDDQCSYYHFKLGKTMFQKAALAKSEIEAGQLTGQARAYFEKALHIEQTAAEYYYELAQNYKDAQEFRLAEILFREAAGRLKGREHKYLNELGNIYFKNDCFGKALACYEEAIEINPRFAVYHSNKGLAYEKLQNYLKAEDAHREALAIQPNDPLILNDVGNVLFLRKKYREASRFFKKAYEIDEQKENRPSAIYAVNYIQALERAGDPEKARQQFGRMLGKITNNGSDQGGAEHEAPLVNSFGNSFYHIKDDLKAARCYQAAVRLDPGNSIYWSNLCLARTATKNFRQAETAIDRAIELAGKHADDKDPISHANLYDLKGTIYIMEGNNYEKAKACYLKAVNLAPENPAYKVKLVVIYDLLKQSALADKVIKDAPKVKSEDADYLKQLGLKYYQMKYFFQAIQSFAEAIAVDEFDHILHYHLGLAYKQIKDYKKAQIELQNAINLKPYDSYYHNELGNLLNDQKKYREALPFYFKAIENEPLTAVFYANAALMYQNLAKDKFAAEKKAREGSPEKQALTREKKKLATRALKYYQKACERIPENPVYLDRSAVFCNDIEYFHLAVDNCKAAIDLDPDNDLYWDELGYAYKNMSLWRESAEAYERAFELKGDSAKYVNMAGYARYFGHEFPEAIRNYKKAIELDPKNSVYHENLALAYRDSNNDEEAIRAYKDTLALLPEGPHRIYLDLGDIFLRNDRLNKAVESYRLAIEKSPADDPQKYNYWMKLGSAWHHIGDYQQEEKSYQQAIRSSPKMLQPYLQIGRFYIDRHNYGEAKNYLSIAIKVDKKSAEAAFLYGKTLYLLGEHSEAGQILASKLIINSKSSEYYTYAALNYLAQDQLHEAHKFLKAALEVDDRNGLAALYLAKTYRLMNNPVEAGAALRSARQFPADTADFDIELYKELKMIGDDARAEEVFKKAGHQRKKDADFWLDFGLAIFVQEPTKAYGCIKTALELEPRNTSLKLKVGQFYFDLKNYEKAVSVFQKILEKETQCEEAICMLVLALEAMGHPDRATAELESGIQRLADESSAMNRLGNLFFKHANHDRASICYRRAINHDPEQIIFHVNLMLALVQAGRFEDAEAAFQEALNRHPENAQYQAALGKELFTQRLDEYAARSFRSARSIAPNVPRYAELLYHMLRVLGADQEAADFLGELSADPDLSEKYWDELGRSLSEMQYPETAIVCFEKAAALSSQPSGYLVSLGGLYTKTKRHAQAAGCYLQILKYSDDPVYVDAFYNSLNQITERVTRENLIQRFQDLKTNQNNRVDQTPTAG